MKYEMMRPDQKVAVLRRLFKRLNKSLYNGALPFPVIVIAKELVTDDGSTAWAGFADHPVTISVSERIIDDGLPEFSAEKQCCFLTRLMLHEMAHLYCYMNGIDDSNHSQAWQEVANSHGLSVAYIDGKKEPEYEELRFEGVLPIVNYKLL